MQRRAAAAYIVLFLVAAAGSYAVIATAQAPTASMDAANAEHTLGQGDQVTVDGRTYTVQSVSGGSQATLAWTNQSAVYTASWENESTRSDLSIGGETLNGSFVVEIAGGDDPTTARLREEANVSTRDLDGTTYVFEDADGDGEADPDELTPLAEYLQAEIEAGNLTTYTLEEGQVDFEGNATTVEITSEAVEFTWRAPRTNTVTARQAANVTLNGREFFGFFASGSAISLFENPSGFETYQEEVETVEYFDERTNGLWGVAIVSLVAAVLMTAMAFLPHKDT